MHTYALMAKQNSRAHIVGKCEICKEERGVLDDEMRKKDEFNSEAFGALLDWR